MKMSRDELKAKLQAEAETAIDGLLGWNDRHGTPTLTEIEDAVLKMRKQIGERTANALIANQDATRSIEVPECPHCGEAMQNKGYRENQVESRVGGLQSKRVYYYCPQCNMGVFPPG